jgi:hypothetical protein
MLMSDIRSSIRLSRHHEAGDCSSLGHDWTAARSCVSRIAVPFIDSCRYCHRASRPAQPDRKSSELDSSHASDGVLCRRKMTYAETDPVCVANAMTHSCRTATARTLALRARCNQGWNASLGPGTADGHSEYSAIQLIWRRLHNFGQLLSQPLAVLHGLS